VPILFVLVGRPRLAVYSLKIRQMCNKNDEYIKTRG
jgi:hypothetical protein